MPINNSPTLIWHISKNALVAKRTSIADYQSLPSMIKINECFIYNYKNFLNEHALWYLTFEYVSKQHCKRQGQKFLFCSQKISNTFADKFSCIIDCIALLMTTYDDFY